MGTTLKKEKTRYGGGGREKQREVGENKKWEDVIPYVVKIVIFHDSIIMYILSCYGKNVFLTVYYSTKGD